MSYKAKYIIVCCAIFSFFQMSCTSDKIKNSDLSSFHNGFRGIHWGESFDVISEKVLLTRTDFGGNDREPGYQVLSGMSLSFEEIPVTIYFQFVKNKLVLIHIYGDKDHKDTLISTLYKLYGEPIIFPSKGTAIWQDVICSMALQENLADGGCLFSLLNNDNYMKLTGKMMRYY